MTIRLTNSEARTWRRCKRKWWLSQYRGLQRVGATDFNRPLGIGSRLHSALQTYYAPGADPSVEHTMEVFHAGVERDVEQHTAYEEDIRKEADLVQAMLEGYFEWLEEEGSDSDFKVLEPEAEVEHPLIDGVTILSKIDARIERTTDGARGALEHKSVGNFKQAIPRLQTDTQLLTEHLVEFLTLLDEKGDEAKDARAQFILYNMLRKVKRSARANPPFFQRESVSHNLNELRTHWRHVARLAQEILDTRAELDAGAEHHDVCYPNPTTDCDWDCEFKIPCQGGLFDDGSDVEAYLADNFEEGDPLERYRKQVGLPSAAESPEVEVGSD